MVVDMRQGLMVSICDDDNELWVSTFFNQLSNC
jgi:hypothetical protein